MFTSYTHNIYRCRYACLRTSTQIQWGSSHIIYIYLFIYLYIYIYIYISIYIFIYLFLSFFVYFFVCLFVCLFAYLFIYMCVYLFIYSCMYLFIWAVAKTPMYFSSNPTCLPRGLPRCFRDHSFSFRGWLVSWFCFRGASVTLKSSSAALPRSDDQRLLPQVLPCVCIYIYIDKYIYAV